MSRLTKVARDFWKSTEGETAPARFFVMALAASLMVLPGIFLVLAIISSCGSLEVDDE